MRSILYGRQRQWMALLPTLCLFLFAGSAWSQSTANPPQAAGFKPATAVATPDLPYTVVPGDTLIGLQERLLLPSVSWQQLQRHNRVRDPVRLQPGSTLWLPWAWLQQQAMATEVLHAQGEVTVERQGSPKRRLNGGDSLNEGDTVRTGAQSSASLRLGDGSRILLRPDSQLVIVHSRTLGQKSATDHRLQLGSGSADTQTAPSPARTPLRLNVDTPVVNLGVRGTNFRARAQDNTAWLEVLDGQVAAGTRAVDAGAGVVATPAGVSAPSTLLSAPNLSTLPGRLDRLPLTLSWPGVSGASRYRAQLFSDNASNTLLLESVVDTAQVRWVDTLPDGSYRLQVRAADAAGLEGRDASHAFVLKARPQPPFLTRPAADAQLTEGSVSFAWTRSTEATRYRLQVASTADFGTPLFDNAAVADPSQVIDLTPGTYFWRVASMRADGEQGPWSDPQQLTRLPPPPNPPPAAPPLQTPEKADQGLVLRWRGEAGQGFMVQVARDANFSTLVVDQTVNQPQWLLKDPAPGRYFMRVAAIGSQGQAGAFGDVQIIDVEAKSRWWLWLPALLLFLL